MRMLVRMPNWLGDAVMATPALHNLRTHYAEAECLLVGSPGVAQLFTGDARFRAVVPDRSRTHRVRALGLWNLGRQLRREYGPFDLAITFQNNLSSRLLLLASGARRRVGRKYSLADVLLTDAVAANPQQHHAEIYATVVNGYLGTQYATGPTWLPVPQVHEFPRPTAGLHAGAAYGNARRWPPEKFIETAVQLARDFDLVLFGGPDERALVGDMEQRIRAVGVKNCLNVVGQPIAEMVAMIAGLDLLICNDSGPMHMAGALGVPTVAVVGPTDPNLTRAWRNDRLRIVRRLLPCAPCHARTCPLQHHACMRDLAVSEVLEAARSLVFPRLAAAS
jgi:heptosyltransferase-2